MQQCLRSSRAAKNSNSPARLSRGVRKIHHLLIFPLLSTGSFSFLSIFKRIKDDAHLKLAVIVSSNFGRSHQAALSFSHGWCVRESKREIPFTLSMATRRRRRHLGQVYESYLPSEIADERLGSHSNSALKCFFACRRREGGNVAPQLHRPTQLALYTCNCCACSLARSSFTQILTACAYTLQKCVCVSTCLHETSTTCESLALVLALNFTPHKQF